MHANEREPQGTDISLQTYMHIERERERGREKDGKRKEDPKTEIKIDKKK